jgi:hypothetical protein
MSVYTITRIPKAEAVPGIGGKSKYAEVIEALIEAENHGDAIIVAPFTSTDRVNLSALLRPKGYRLRSTTEGEGFRLWVESVPA